MRGLENYEPVEDRIRRFWADHTAGRILTDLIHRDERQYIIRAEVFTDRDDTRPAAVGYAEEVIGSSPVNKTNALENAETSAIGRALANLNYAPKGARPSREEMQKAERRTEITPADVARATLRKACQEHGWDLATVAGRFETEHGVTLKEATNAGVIDKYRESLSGVPQAELAVSA